MRIKRILSMLVIMAMVLSLVTVPTVAEGEASADEVASDNGGSTTITTALDFTNNETVAKGSGYTWDSESKTLTLDGLNLSVSDGSEKAVIVPAGTKIVLAADSENTIVTSKTKSNGICALGNLTIESADKDNKGTLNITVPNHGIKILGDEGVTQANFAFSDILLNIFAKKGILMNANALATRSLTLTGVTYNHKYDSAGENVSMLELWPASGSAALTVKDSTVSGTGEILVKDSGNGGVLEAAIDNSTVNVTRGVLVLGGNSCTMNVTNNSTLTVEQDLMVGSDTESAKLNVTDSTLITGSRGGENNVSLEIGNDSTSEVEVNIANSQISCINGDAGDLSVNPKDGGTKVVNISNSTFLLAGNKSINTAYEVVEISLSDNKVLEVLHSGANLTTDAEGNKKLALTDGATISLNGETYTVVGEADVTLNPTEGELTIPQGTILKYGDEEFTLEEDFGVTPDEMLPTPGKTITISTKDELLEFAAAVNGGKTYEGKTVELGADIDLSGETWNGIGVYNAAAVGTPFSGTFDGKGYKIENVTFAAKEYTGFFNQLYKATVKDLTVEVNGFVEGAEGSCGGAAIAGHAISSTIDNCVAEGKIEGTHNVAGIVVRAEGSTIKNCTNKANLSNSYSKLGGIVNLTQYNAIDTANKATVIDGCINEGTITSTANGSNGVGGIIGWIGYGIDPNNGEICVTIKNCENKGSVTGTDAAVLGQIVGCPNSYWNIPDGNKGRTDILAIGTENTGAFNYATVENGVATYTNTLEAGKTYLVTAKGAKPVIKLAVGEAITFDTTLSDIDGSGITTDGEIIKTTNGNLITYSGPAPAISNSAAVNPEHTFGSVIFGEVVSNVRIKSLVIELYSEDTKLATTTLNNVRNELEDYEWYYASWHTLIQGTVDEYWTTVWEGENPIVNVVPTHIITYVNGEDMGEYPVQYNYDGGTIVCDWKDMPGVKPVPVAQIGDTKYGTLQEAIDAAGAGQTVTLLNDVTINAVDGQPSTHAWVKSDDNVIIDLNGKTVTGAFYIKGTATIKNGTILNNDCVSGIESEGDLTLENMTITSNRHAVRISGGTAVIKSGIYTTTADSSTSGYALNVKSSGSTVTVDGGEFYGGTTSSVTGKSAVTVQTNVDKLIINGGKFCSGATTGTAYSVENYSELSVINGGEFTGALVNGFKNIYGGTFEIAPPEKEVAEGYEITENADGTYGVEEAPKNYVAEVNGTQYESFDEAWKTAVKNGGTQTITLLADAEFTNSNYETNGTLNLTIDLAGNDLTLKKSLPVAGSLYGGNTMTITDTSDAEGNVIFDGDTYIEFFNDYADTLILNGGNYVKKSGKKAIVLDKTYGTVNQTVQINGGTYNEVSTSVIDAKMASDNVTKADEVEVTAPEGYEWNSEGKLQEKEEEPEQKLDTLLGVISYVENGMPELMLFAGIDSLNYDKVGFEIVAGEIKVEYTTETVYRSIKANYQGAPKIFTPKDFSQNANYIFAEKVAFPVAYAGTDIHIRPFAVIDGIDGEECYIYGNKYKFTLENVE